MAERRWMKRSKCRCKKLENYERRDEDGTKKKIIKSEHRGRWTRFSTWWSWEHKENKEHSEQEMEKKKVDEAEHVQLSCRTAAATNRGQRRTTCIKRECFIWQCINATVWVFNTCLYHMLISGCVTWRIASIHFHHHSEEKPRHIPPDAGYCSYLAFGY